MSCTDDRRVVFRLKGRRSKVNEANVCRSQNFLLPRGTIALSGNWDMDDVKIVVDEKDILWLEIRMDQAKVVKERHTAKQLSREILDMVTGKGGEFVLLQKVIDTHAQKLRDQAYVVPMIEPMEEMNAFISVQGIAFFELL